MNWLAFILLAIVSFIQNMAFTWVSRSRNSGDPGYHRYASWCSNGVWLICQLFMVKLMWKPIFEGHYLQVVVGGLIYVISTTEGSVLMMKILLKREKGKRQVGARDEKKS